MSSITSQTLPLIAHVVESFGGGVFQSVSQLCHGLKDKAKFVIVHDIRAETPANFAESFPEGTEFVQLSMGRAISPKDIAATLRLRRVLTNLKPHAVHAHSSKAGALTRVALIGTGIPRYYSPRGYSFLMINASAKKRAVYWLAERILGVLPGTTVACGYDELTFAKQVSNRAVAIPNGISPQIVAHPNRSRPHTADILQIVSSGRISPQKNFPLFCQIASAFTDKPVQFTWVGGGDIPPETVIPANVKVTGWLPHAQSLAELNKGQVYLHMSAWEGLSRIVLEAMAHGFPLILSDIPGNRELASANNAFLCKSAEDAIAAITKFIAQPQLVSQMGQASRKHLEDSYNWDTNLHKWQNLYNIGTHASRMAITGKDTA